MVGDAVAFASVGYSVTAVSSADRIACSSRPAPTLASPTTATSMPRVRRSSANAVSGSVSRVLTTMVARVVVIPVEIAPVHGVGRDLHHVGSTREGETVGAQVVHPAPAPGQAEVEPEHVGRLEHGDPCALPRRPLGDPEPRQVAAEHDDVGPPARPLIEQPGAEVVDRVHVREIGTGQRRTRPARAGGHDDRVGPGRDHRLRVHALPEAQVDTPQLELVLEPPQQVGVDVGRGGRVRPAPPEARGGVDQRDRVAAQRRDPRCFHPRRSPADHEHRTG